ncbi:MAG: protoheme IX farnesyltransferase [Anaerolineaceae bacterium]|nr:protoheme IX farnesyltransferase [Anaerolineaceae bacterium]
MKKLKKLIEILTTLKIIHFIIFNIIIFGLMIVMNSMTRFENQIFSCTFWLTCENDGFLSNSFNLITQLILSSLGLLSLLIAKIFYSNKRENKFDNKFFVFTLIQASLVFLVSLYSFFIKPAHPFIPTFFSMLLTIVMTTWFVQRKYVNDVHVKLPVKNKLQSLVLISSIFMIGLGILISFTGSSKLCNQFPICFSTDGLTIDMVLVNAHRFFTLTTGLLITKFLFLTWRKNRENYDLLLSVTISFIVFIGQSMIGGIQAIRNLPMDLLFVHSISSVIYLLAVIYAFHAGQFVHTTSVLETKTIFNDSQRRKDFLILNKPIIVALLLVTTYAGMVVGGEKIPSFSLTFWTMLGGALAAGGASAINQYIDREIDLSMQRTAKRPLPSRRLHPAEALALGISEIILSFYVFVAFVNLNSALLAMAGMIYYVFIYSSWLKHITVQNIVIGGGAGAIPPLVGWAAATGGLNIPSLLLFALVFLWTPPHFWALALVRKNDYARASIPMMPVIKGEKKTRFQILIYTIQLVVLTLIMPLFGIGGSVFFILATVLGLWLLSTAWQVFKMEGNKIAFKMYRYSSMYLAFIFFAMVIDVLL